MTATPTELRDAGMRQAEDHADPRLMLMVDELIATANASGEQWSANDIRDLMPVVGQGLVGARVRAASMRRPAEMVKVSETASTLPSTHGKTIAVWRGVAPLTAPSAAP